MDGDEHLLAMAADSGHSGDAGDAHPDLEPDPDPGPMPGWKATSPGEDAR
jgi:hypothetical protein